MEKRKNNLGTTKSQLKLFYNSNTIKSIDVIAGQVRCEPLSLRILPTLAGAGSVRWKTSKLEDDVQTLHR